MTDSAPTFSLSRQAILDKNNAVFGYELCDRSVSGDDHTSATDAQLLFNLLCTADAESVLSTKLLFIHCSHTSLAGAHLDLIEPKRVVLQVGPLPISQVADISNYVANLQHIKQRGFRLAFDYSVLTQPYSSWLPLASFIKFDLSILKPEAVSAYVQLATAQSKAQLVAERVETQAQQQLMANSGVALFQGSWFAKPVRVQGQTVQPAMANILQLINLVRKHASTDEIEAVLKRDPNLSFNLLRFINSAGFGARSEVTSFKHAVMLLGLNRLFKWAALLMGSAKGSGTPPAVGTTAVVRGRLMELLAIEMGMKDEADYAFVVGIFSLLDTMLGLSMQEAMATMSLPENVSNALLHRTGPLAALLNLTIACDSNDDTAFATAITELGLSDQQVNWAHLQAMAWADSMGV